MNKGLQCVSALESSGIFDLACERKVAQSLALFSNILRSAFSSTSCSTYGLSTT